MKRIISLIVASVISVLVLSVTAFAGVTGDVPIFCDKTGSVTDSGEISKLLEEVSESHGVVVAAVIVETLEGKSAEAYADDYYDYNNFAYDDNYDGVLLLISNAERKWHISTSGKCIDYFSDEDIDDIGEEMLPALSAKNYGEAVRIFIAESDSVIYSATHFSVFYIVISVAVGIVIGFFIVNSMKSKMKTVRHKSEARDYLREGSLDLRERSDTFLYRNVRRVKRETSSGSSTHTGSSGRSHGGGGGSF